jgi:hypothetical protein
VENPLLEVIKHADLDGMDKVGLRDGAHDTGNMLKYVDSSMTIARRDVGIGCLGIGIAERSI